MTIEKGTHKVSVGAGFVRAVFVFCLALMTAGGVYADQVPDYLAVCTGCVGEEDFAFAAVNEAPDARPGDGTARIYPVYVANLNLGQVMFFQVHVQRDSGVITPFAGSAGYEFGTYKIAYRSSGDADVEAAILEGIPIAMDFAESLGGTLTGEVITTVGTAIDLVGPEDSPAGYARMQLEADINSYYDGLWNELTMSAAELSSRIAGKVLGDSSIVQLESIIEIQFEDGTSIKVRVDEILDGVGATTDFHLELTVLPHTARLPDGRVVPQTAGQFTGFNWSGTGGENLGLALARLAGIYGLDVGEPGEALDCTFECDGDGYCRLSC